MLPIHARPLDETTKRYTRKEKGVPRDGCIHFSYYGLTGGFVLVECAVSLLCSSSSNTYVIVPNLTA